MNIPANQWNFRWCCCHEYCSPDFAIYSRLCAIKPRGVNEAGESAFFAVVWRRSRVYPDRGLLRSNWNCTAMVSKHMMTRFYRAWLTLSRSTPFSAWNSPYKISCIKLPVQSFLYKTWFRLPSFELSLDCEMGALNVLSVCRESMPLFDVLWDELDW